MKVGEDWKLIDLDAAAKIGEKAGLKSSTGYVPPELLILSSAGEACVRDPTQADALTADPSFDMWSFGALLYLLITGETLFNNNMEDNLNNRDLLRLCEWDVDDLEDALDNVHNSQGKHQPLGRDLLEKLLQPAASNRPKTMANVLKHPFFVGESPEELEKEIKKLQAQLEGARAEAGRGGSDQTAIITMFAQQLEDLKRGQAEIQSTTQRVAPRVPPPIAWRKSRKGRCSSSKPSISAPSRSKVYRTRPTTSFARLSGFSSVACLKRRKSPCQRRLSSYRVKSKQMGRLPLVR
jgi:hypothetical protein